MKDIEKKIISIKVNNLYGFLNHSIQLREDGSTIIYGPNGSGKTTFLKIIYALFDKNFENLFFYEFESIEIGYTNGDILKIDKLEVNDSNELSRFAVRTALGLGKDFPEEIKKRNGFSIKYNFYIVTGDDLREVVSLYQYEVLDFLKKGSWILDTFFRNEKLRRNHEYENNTDDEKAEKKLIFTDILENYISPYDFYFIDINRTINMDVLKKDDKDLADLYKVKSYANDLSNIIKYAVAKSEETTERSNKSFPQRMIESFRSNNNKGINEEEIRSKYKRTQEDIDKIIKMGLLFRENNISLPSENVNLSVNELTVLSIYLSDLNKKIELYNDIVNKIEVFKDIVGKKIRNKTMHINMDKGFYFRSKFTNPEEDLRLDLLSSGEQHQISLFYQLIFLAKDSTFFLIDEPEISLHVDWQRGFLSGLQKISKIRNHRFLIATHSPQIINGNLDLCEPMDMGEDYENE
ncbi:AAA family ATPase [uncultured Acinetobacter sp.]|uniref:AAA family ATPase n=1 Tax=uncultured Acinetobacter sp. TaxID=165433 RepID=UPI00258F33ED|nr:AAA family ATPase [uncultured Acinetobacter sp.]